MPMLSEYENQWVSFPVKMEDEEIIEGSLATYYPLDSALADKLTDEQKEKIYELTRTAHLIKEVKKLSPESINGVSSYHFQFDHDRQGITAYIKNLEEYITTIGKNDSELSSFNSEDFTNELENIKNFEGEMWIGRNDKLPYKIMLSFMLEDEENLGAKVKVNAVSIFSGWNQPVAISAPSESIAFETLIAESFGEAQQKSSEAMIRASLVDLRAEGEIFYDNNLKNAYSGFCSSDVVKRSREQILYNGGTEFICKDSKTAWATQAKLPNTSTYWCVDSMGASWTTKTSLVGTICK